MRLFAVKFEALRKETTILAQTLERFLVPAVARNFELTRSGDDNLDLVAFLELERFDEHLGQADLYLVSSDTAKANRAELLLSSGGIISVQVRNEFAAVALGKKALAITDVRQILGLDPCRLHCQAG